MDKFDNLTVNSCANDRVIARVSIQKVKSSENGLTLGISIVQGSDNKVYVKDLVKNGPGARSGIQIGDQVRLSLASISHASQFIISPKSTDSGRGRSDTAEHVIRSCIEITPKYGSSGGFGIIANFPTK